MGWAPYGEGHFNKSANILAVEVADLILDKLDLKQGRIRFFTDSKVVLGYINNETR